MNPRTVGDLTLGAYIAIEATVAPGQATSAGFGRRLDLSNVKILWEAARNNAPPRAIEDSLMLDPGHYVLLLGAGTAGHWYVAEGYRGAFAYADQPGDNLTVLCVVYTNDGKAHPPVKAPGSISRKKLLTLLKAAPLPDSMYSPHAA